MKDKKNYENNIDQILIAEDSPTQAKQLKHLLEKNNYKVMLANNGKEALRLISENKPSLIISDIIMPEMDGYELCKEIKSDEKTFDIPVILLTSLSRSEDVLEGISCGADNFITKPYSESYLISHIKQILANKEIYKNERVRIGVEIVLGSKRRFITASQQQMLTLLISTYEAAVQRNDELIKTQFDLKKLNDHLEEAVAERTTELSAEIAIRKRAEEGIKKLNRVYAVLSNINQAIVRIHDVKQLLQDACLIAVDEGKFQSAWIGILNNKTKKIATSTTAGLANNLIEVSPDHNPIINVMQSGKHFISNNIAADKSLTDAWKQNSFSLKFRSLGVFPLIVLGKVIGGFCIYSNEVDFFDEIEISLLDEMATDISFALEYIQKESERIQAEKALQEKEKNFKDLFDNAPVGYHELDADGRITRVNRTELDMLGYTEEEMIGQFVWNFVRDEEIFHQRVLGKMDGIYPPTKSGERVYCRKDQTIFPVLTEEIILRDTLDNIIGIRVTMQDITERKFAEKALIEAKEKAEEMNHLKNCFLSNMSHEFRTPLVSILGFAELLQQELNDPEHLEFVKNIMEGGQRLNSTLSEILEISKLEAAISLFKLQPYNLADGIKDLVKSFLPIAQSKRLFLKTELSDAYITAQIDSELFDKALFHLVDNGIKFTKEGGVLVTLNHERKQDQDWAVTKVIDTGIGISKANLNKIFNEFQQASEGHGRSYEGTGLGITIAKKVVELMKGHIEVESDVGKGSVFSIWLPAIPNKDLIHHQVEEKKLTTIIEPPTSQEKGLQKVLIIDDNSSNRLFMNHCLISYVKIIEAEDGISGIAFASKGHFKLILMDINLGAGIDGVEAMHQIRKIQGYECVPIIAVTAYAMFGEKERFLSGGFDDYLAKPFTKDDLISLVEKCLAKVKK
jgi:PAS domain S-box-containing protein